MTTLEDLDRDCKDHDRTSCSDEQPVNAGVDLRYGHTWCRRCQGLWQIKAEAALTEQGEEITDKQIDSAMESMPNGYTGFLKSWGYRQFARAILALRDK